jgi:hypothetical protein
MFKESIMKHGTYLNENCLMSTTQYQLQADNQQHFSLRTNQPPVTSQQYFSLRTNQHQPPAKRSFNQKHMMNYFTNSITQFIVITRRKLNKAQHDKGNGR